MNRRYASRTRLQGSAADSAPRKNKPGFRGRRQGLLLAGVLLIVAGALLLAKQWSTSAARAREEAKVSALYHAAASNLETTLQPAPETTPDALPPLVTAAPVQAGAVPARSFATKTWTNLITRGRFLPLRDINPDIAGWLTIKGMLDLPVMQRDNAYYLTHDFRNAASVSGALFLDENFSLIPPCENLLIHGHNMRDGSMFGHLQRYKDRAYYAAHCIIRFESLYDEGDYAIFAAYTMVNDRNDPAYLPFAYAHFGSDAYFAAYVSAVKTRSCFPCGLDIAATDQLLTLSTCAGGNAWFVIIARRVRADEKISDVTLECIMTSYR
jgi:sortase B